MLVEFLCFNSLFGLQQLLYVGLR